MKRLTWQYSSPIHRTTASRRTELVTSELYPDHIKQLCTRYSAALELEQCQSLSGVVIHSGSEQHYFGDDRAVPFQAYGHFCNWLPVNRPDQFLLIRPDNKPVYFQIVPSDFWYDQQIDNEPWWAEQFAIVQLSSVAELRAHLSATGLAYLGESPDMAQELGLASSDEAVSALRCYLDFHRAWKSEYEIGQLQAAVDKALLAHQVARDSFLAGGSEYEIHHAYLAACKAQEQETPYTNIVAINEKSAILHYQQKRIERLPDSAVLLIDAGCRVNNYGSDITRTTATDAAHPVFHDLLAGMEKLELEIVAAVRPDINYVDLHEQALAGVADLLIDTGICAGKSEDLLAQQVPQLFMPHGVGHLLGVQVHDVGGHQGNISGEQIPPPAHSPALRNTRTLSANMVFTIEPGCYFIPLILEAERRSERGKSFNWQLIEALYPFGGIRIEDNVVVTGDGQINLSRPGQGA